MSDYDPGPRRLHSGFLDHVELRPDAVCLDVDGTELTYSTLHAEARALAGALTEVVGRRPERVAVWSARGRVGYGGLLASLFSGATFVPLGPGYPVERTRAMLEQADVDAIVAEEAGLERLLEAVAALDVRPPILVPRAEREPSFPRGVRGFGPRALERAPALDRLPDLAADSAAYILFTSGSTGRPKGVPITHANILHYLDINQARYRITPEDRHSMTCDFTFDNCFFDVFMPWNAGARVCPLGPLDQLTAPRFVDRHGITVWFSVPSIVALLGRGRGMKPGSMPTLRWSLFAGEALPLVSAEAWLEAAPASTVENLYGPTELSVDVTAYRFDPATSPAECVNGTVPIGTPYPDVHLLVLDEHDEPAEEGALCVAGPQTFGGYWRDAERTAEVLFDAPDADGAVRRWYRTGDRVRRLPSGSLLYLGRSDSQVQVLGSRVELGEIEAALREGTGVTLAAAVAWPMRGPTAEGIVAFVSGSSIDAAALRRSLQETLPPFSLPRRIEVLDRMPLNANGKIDRLALVARLEAEESSA